MNEYLHCNIVKIVSRRTSCILGDTMYLGKASETKAASRILYVSWKAITYLDRPCLHACTLHTTTCTGHCSPCRHCHQGRQTVIPVFDLLVVHQGQWLHL